MAILRWPDKDPNAVKDYAVDWSSRLLTGETIVSGTWTPNAPTLVVETGEHAPAIVGSVCTCWLSGGIVNTNYAITNRIVTSRGMIDDQTVLLRITEQ